jgi:hypothetical protein
MALNGEFLQVLVGGYELTGDSNKISINDKRQLYEVTAFVDQVKNYISGKRMIALDHSGYMNSAAGKSHPVLKAGNIQAVFSAFLGQNANPVVGDPTYSIFVQDTSYKALPEVGKYVPFNSELMNAGSLGGWGIALTPPTTITNTATGTGVNEGASSSNGGAAFLHVLGTSTPDTYTVIVEGANDAGFTTGLTTLATFTLNGSALGSERKAIAGTIPQYTRWKATRSGAAGNNFKFAVSLARF